MVQAIDLEVVQQEDRFYEDRFLESCAGSIITNPSTASQKDFGIIDDNYDRFMAKRAAAIADALNEALNSEF